VSVRVGFDMDSIDAIDVRSFDAVEPKLSPKLTFE
jgi:hypothetical protein